MTRRGWLALGAVLGLVPSVEAHANPGREPDADAGRNVVGTDVGFDGAVIAWSLRYARVVPLPRVWPLIAHARFTMPMTKPDFGDWRMQTGLRTDVLRVSGFRWPVSLAFVARAMSNRSVRAWGLGTELMTMPGWYAPRWFAAAEVSWDQQWGTRLRHSDAYREVVNPDVVDGWYRTTGFTMRYGARVGGQPWRHMELWLRGGYEQHGRFNRLAPPLYLVVGVGFYF